MLEYRVVDIVLLPSLACPAGGDPSIQRGVPGLRGGGSAVAGRRAHEGALPDAVCALPGPYSEGPEVQEEGRHGEPCGGQGAGPQQGRSPRSEGGESVRTRDGGAIMGVQEAGKILNEEAWMGLLCKLFYCT